MRIALLIVMASGTLSAQEDVVLKAMHDEMERSVKKLHLENLEKPYFISYRVQERNAVQASATFGNLVSTNEARFRLLTVEVRVGDYALDNTNFLSGPSYGSAGVSRMFGGTVQLPLDDDYDELRRQMWLATDGVYKKALEDLAKKKAALQNKTRPEEVADFSKEEPVKMTDLRQPIPLDRAAIEKLVRDLSGLFRQAREVFYSSAHADLTNVHVRFVDSEGRTYLRSAPSVSLIVRASSQAKDGLPLEDSYAVYGHSLDELGEATELSKRVKELAARFDTLRDAPVVERYNGPVLFEGAAAAEALAQAFAPKLLGIPRQVAGNPQFEAMAAAGNDGFVDRIGSRVLPVSFDVTDNPLVDSIDGERLLGARKVDDEGIPARETRLVERGILKTLLSTRAPVRGIPHSTGSRRGQGPAPSNLIVTADNPIPLTELRMQLVKLAKDRGSDHGIIVRRLRNPNLTASMNPMAAAFFAGGLNREGARLEPAILAYRVYADGREELIRNVMFSGLTEASFKEIVGVSKEQVVHTTPISIRYANPFSFTPFDAGPRIVSIVIPSLLFEELTLQPPQGEVPKPPVSRHPYFEK